ncbi:uncharacterized protein LACBIDRAFT_296406 [Laccaria bicolor S238N-H82]|uniref:Predicted protein n=1 Tax=Laccaria bicolor (strain S238N-H82 / ATCC MYA-4686) TaxID=486041 RepID=B0D8Q6_LACBS|nr:uncharacterized protein LACBIDRAFT_296406 [Laccaria bicolor S238N-H82]EDR08885.1 predicted protein [Laccaria bicolor S238N-H82]|eukprot:XP_001880198.1 predicted protein [Laccaria bicolor S238N-H82]
MAFDFSTLEPQIRQILSAPGTDLATISAKRVRRQLLDLNPSLTAEFLKENKDNVDAIISGVFEQVSPVDDTEDAREHPVEVEEKSASRKRRQQKVDEQSDGGDEDEESPPPPKKAKKAKKDISDAELARKLSSEINSRSTRTGGKSRGSSNSGAKKGGRKKKSAATVNSDDDSDDNVTEKKPKKPSGGAKGGFAKEFLLSEPLAAVLQVNKLSRPQVVKQLWVYIKGNELQNPENKREIMCDVNLKAVFGVDKIDMFKMNKVLGQHLHENEG